MGLTGTRTYVGFGFGAIQAGLFLYEAFGSGNFARLVVAEVVPEVVARVRSANGYYSVNIAHSDRLEHAQVGPVQVEDPALEPDRARLVDAIAAAGEIGTAIPSVQHYVSAGPGSLHRVLAAGLRKKVASNGPRAVVYAAENHNYAAQILESKVLAEIPEDEREAVRSRVQFLNTVIGKMSGAVPIPPANQAQGLTPITPGEHRAFLVEAFNRILISKVRAAFEETEAEWVASLPFILEGEPPFRRGIAVFEEKEDLLPFEEAKLYGHNATHALAAYLGAVRGTDRIADLRDIPGVMSFLRAAFIEESGAALIRRHHGVDPLFTAEGYTRYAEDLLARMTNPHLQDTIERVGRDPARKLGWDDRLIGTMRVALGEGMEPRRYALGAAAALATIDSSILRESVPIEALLTPLWSGASPEEGEKEAVLRLIEDGQRQLMQWRDSGFQNLERLFR